MVSMAERGRGTFGLVQIAIVTLLIVTALIHFQVGFSRLGGALLGYPQVETAVAVSAVDAGGLSLLKALTRPLPETLVLTGLAYELLGAALYLQILRRFRRLSAWR
jgi:hypothetical protein